MQKLLRRINITKAQRIATLQFVIATLMGYFALGSIKVFVLALVVLLVTNYLTLKRLISTKKRSVLIVKTIRPWLYFIGAVLLIGVVGNKDYSLWVHIGIAVAIAGVYGWFLRYELRYEAISTVEHIIALVLLFLCANSASLLMALTSIPAWLVLSFCWGAIFIVANSWLFFVSDHPESLSLVWALIAIEFGLMSSFWIVFYSMFGLGILISQFALIITTLGYSLGGIYYHYKKRSLSRSLIFEYLAVAVIVFGVLIVLTHWRSAV